MTEAARYKIIQASPFGFRNVELELNSYTGIGQDIIIEQGSHARHQEGHQGIEALTQSPGRIWTIPFIRLDKPLEDELMAVVYNMM